jgi:hypothetical protein
MIQCLFALFLFPLLIQTADYQIILPTRIPPDITKESTRALIQKTDGKYSIKTELFKIPLPDFTEPFSSDISHCFLFLVNNSTLKKIFIFNNLGSSKIDTTLNTKKFSGIQFDQVTGIDREVCVTIHKKNPTHFLESFFGFPKSVLQIHKADYKESFLMRGQSIIPQIEKFIHYDHNLNVGTAENRTEWLKGFGLDSYGHLCNIMSHLYKITDSNAQDLDPNQYTDAWNRPFVIHEPDKWFEAQISDFQLKCFDNTVSIITKTIDNKVILIETKGTEKPRFALVQADPNEVKISQVGWVTEGFCYKPALIHTEPGEPKISILKRPDDNQWYSRSEAKLLLNIAMRISIVFKNIFLTLIPLMMIFSFVTYKYLNRAQA